MGEFSLHISLARDSRDGKQTIQSSKGYWDWNGGSWTYTIHQKRLHPNVVGYTTKRRQDAAHAAHMGYLLGMSILFRRGREKDEGRRDN